jgi:tetratricopeptide (TPR) repeat protein
MRRVTLLGTVLLAGCVYYNGVYNAKRLAHSAERAERDGRTIDAKDAWAQVIVKADSVVARHPASGYVPQVQLLRARALARLDQCAAAIPALEQSLPLSTDSAAIAAGIFELARCRAASGDVAGAADAYGRLANARNPAMRHEARFQYARALRLAGKWDAALAALDSAAPDPRVGNERMVALAGAGRLAEALVIADSAVARADTGAAWDSLLSAAGTHDPTAVSKLVDRLVTLPHATLDMKARWLYTDGRRLLGVDTSLGDARLAEAGLVGGASEWAGRARLLRTEMAMARTQSATQLGPVVDSLAVLREVNGAQAEAYRLYDAAVRVRAAGDSTVLRGAQGDLVLFLAAEAARDALATPTLSRILFRQMMDAWPASPYAPKALLALHQLDPTMSDDFDSLIQLRYPNSPYVAALHGLDVPQLRLLEDSLRAFAAGHAAGRIDSSAARAGKPTAPGQQPGSRRTVEPQ